MGIRAYPIQRTPRTHTGAYPRQPHFSAADFSRKRLRIAAHTQGASCVGDPEEIISLKVGLGEFVETLEAGREDPHLVLNLWEYVSQMLSAAGRAYNMHSSDRKKEYQRRRLL